ncbi:MAG: sulfatase-like hydrolase/transferase [Proteobacteria bacterium]|nr:sulfatase-like hydrolase/transferase [Pseudomonadota bacterium]MBI3499217.1 sulfatase-like hydrolase/transferase [Pseudomonadota bacterium]
MTKPNIILIMADQQRADSLACYGNMFTVTPHLDRLARGGVRFTRAFTNWPVCTPARGTMWTGVYPHAHGLIENVYGIPDAFQSVAKVRTTLFHHLKRLGYVTAHFGKWHLGEAKPDYFDVWEASFNSRVHHWVGGLDSGKYRPELQTDRAIEFLRGRKPGDAPFLIVQGFYPPHDPYTAPQRFYAPYRGRGIHCAGYYAAVTALDHEVGRLLAALEDTQQADDTAILYFADHGDTFFYREDGEHKFVCFEEAILIPFLMTWPKHLPEGRVVSQPITLADLLPTVVQLAGGTVPESAHGRSALGLARGEAVAWPDHVYIQNTTHKRRLQQRCYRTERWKLIASLNGPHSLYDLARDPEEELDLFELPREDEYSRFKNEPSHAVVARDYAHKLQEAAAAIDDRQGIAIGDQVIASLARP